MHVQVAAVEGMLSRAGVNAEEETSASMRQTSFAHWRYRPLPPEAWRWRPTLDRKLHKDLSQQLVIKKPYC